MLFIAGRSRWVTATNSLTRYGFLQSRLESHCSAPHCCRRTRRESVNAPPATATAPKKKKIKKNFKKRSKKPPQRTKKQTSTKAKRPWPQIIPSCDGFCVLPKFPAPRPRSVCSGFSSPTKGKVDLWRPSSPSSSPPTRLLYQWCQKTNVGL